MVSSGLSFSTVVGPSGSTVSSLSRVPPVAPVPPPADSDSRRGGGGREGLRGAMLAELRPGKARINLGFNRTYY